LFAAAQEIPHRFPKNGIYFATYNQPVAADRLKDTDVHAVASPPPRGFFLPGAVRRVSTAAWQPVRAGRVLRGKVPVYPWRFSLATDSAVTGNDLAHAAAPPPLQA